LLHSDLHVEIHLVGVVAAAVLVELDKLVAGGLRRCLQKAFEWDFNPASGLKLFGLGFIWLFLRAAFGFLHCCFILLFIED